MAKCSADWSRLLFAVIAVVGSAYGIHPAPKEPRNAASQIDIQAIFRAVGVPDCIQRCSVGLAEEIKKVLAMEDSMDNYGFLCSEYRKAQECVSKNQCSHADIYEVVTSGVGSLCGKKEPFIRKNEVCLKQNIDLISNQCDGVCNFVDSLVDFSQELAKRRVGLLKILEELGPMCKTAHCFLPCFRDRMNAKCSRSGSILTDAFLRPFYSVAKYIEENGEIVQKFVRERVPKECLYLTNKATLDGIRQSLPPEMRDEELPTMREDPNVLIGG